MYTYKIYLIVYSFKNFQIIIIIKLNRFTTTNKRFQIVITELYIIKRFNYILHQSQK
jgi:hypothetical protein